MLKRWLPNTVTILDQFHCIHIDSLPILHTTLHACACVHVRVCVYVCVCVFVCVCVCGGGGGIGVGVCSVCVCAARSDGVQCTV